MTTPVDDFLVEIGCEELPPKALQKLSLAFAENLQTQLQKVQLNFTHIERFATPRRLALRVNQLQLQQADQNIQRLGPAVAAAFDAKGNATPAATGFARSCGVNVDELERVDSDKGERLAYQMQQTGIAAAELLPALIEQALKQLPIPKMMRWGAYECEFVRPVHWIIMLLGADIVPGELFGHASGRNSRGHRFHHSDDIIIDHAKHYEILLQEAKVIASFAARKAAISEQLQSKTTLMQASIADDDNLLNEVCALVEWPVVYTAKFDDAFLKVPQEALIAAMRDHQKSFHLLDKDHNLLPAFAFVSNIESQQAQRVIDGNERVMRARLADAAFFYEQDSQRQLIDRLDDSKTIVYQKQLGTLHEKITRLQQLSQNIAQQIHCDVALAGRAAQLAKCDLLSDMVNEFPELQGIMGYYYALNDNENIEVAIAIREHYWPNFAGDRLPSTAIASCVALAERLDTLVGVFAIGAKPTGEKDPFKCRRAAIGIVRILVEQQHHLNLADLLQNSLSLFAKHLVKAEIITDVQQYILERMKMTYQERGIHSSTFAAVVACEQNDLADIDKRVHAVHQFHQHHSAQALATANKRVSRILSKDDTIKATARIDQNLLNDEAEKHLAEVINAQQQRIAELQANQDYTALLQELAQLEQPLDQFFEHVMVNVDDPAIRQNRLALLSDLRGLFLKVADISLLQPAS